MSAGERRFSRDHEWARLDDGRYVVGISDFAQDSVGDVVFVDLPQVGTHAAAGDAVAEVESTKTVSSVLVPLSGTVVAVNETLAASPEQINADPYGKGWLSALEADQDSEFEGLMDEAAYLAFVSDTST